MMGPVDTSGGLFEAQVEADRKQRQVRSTMFTIKNSMMNKPCPCNSGKKFKKCCLSKARAAIRKEALDE